jgi:hypothetical protein
MARRLQTRQALILKIEKRKKVETIWIFSQLNNPSTSLFPKAKRRGSIGSNRWFSVR